MESTAVKISDLLINPANKHRYSIEVSPGLDTELVRKFKPKPLFCSVTWHARTHLCNGLDLPSVALAEELTKQGHTVMIHVSCDRMRSSYLDSLLERLKSIGIRNIFVIQGVMVCGHVGRRIRLARAVHLPQCYEKRGPYRVQALALKIDCTSQAEASVYVTAQHNCENFESSLSDFKYAMDLVLHIRERTGDWFCVGVAGYPAGDSRALNHLKLKVDSGADFVITQAFLDASVYLEFVRRCREIGLQIPIVPGIFLFETLSQLEHFSNICNVQIDKGLLDKFDCSRSDVGVQVCVDIVKELAKKYELSFHYFTLNKIGNFMKIIESIDL